MEMTKIDRISKLTNHIVEETLSRLWTRDAVRTCVLSKKWRHRWTAAPSHAFSLQQFDSVDELVGTIHHLLQRRVGWPIHKFKLHYDLGAKNKFMNIDDPKNVLSRDVMDSWILHLSRSHIKELSLWLYTRQRYVLPSCIFSCSLTKLEPSECSLRPPKTFRGFRNLKSLHLFHATLTRDVLEILICRSPEVESVVLLVDLGQDIENINVDAPNLRVFKFLRKRTNHISFRSTSRLAEVVLLWAKPDRSRTLKIYKIPNSFYHLLHVEKLTLKALGGLPRDYPLQNLRYLCMDVNFSHQKEILVALCLLKSALNLQELKIQELAGSIVKNIDYSKLFEAHQMNCVLTKLRRVRMDHILGCNGEIGFVNYMFSTSPALETMTIWTILLVLNRTWNSGCALSIPWHGQR